jgi:hypothetical protein
MHFWIDTKFTNILGQFKQKNICRFIYDMQFEIIFNPLSFFLVSYNTFFNTLLKKLQDNIFIWSTWINFEKKKYVKIWIFETISCQTQ